MSLLCRSQTVEIPTVASLPVVFNDRCRCPSAENCEGPAVAAHLNRVVDVPVVQVLLVQFIDNLTVWRLLRWGWGFWRFFDWFRKVYFMVVFLKVCPLSLVFIVALYVPWCRHLESLPVQPQLHADNLKCSAARLVHFSILLDSLLVMSGRLVRTFLPVSVSFSALQNLFVRL